MSIGNTLKGAVKGLLGTSNESNVRRFTKMLDGVAVLEPELQQLDDAALRQKGEGMRAYVKSVADLDDALPLAFALVREVADRRIGIWKAIVDSTGRYTQADAWGAHWPAIAQVREQLAAGTPAWDLNLPAAIYAHVRSENPDSVPPYRMRAHDVQIIGGAVLHSGAVAEMKTGEGKTLVACFASFLNALSSKVHVITVNDYLAKRDSEWNAPVLRFLGISVGSIQSTVQPHERVAIYDCDVIYGTNSEFGFDYLRDNLKQTREDQVQKVHNFAIVDEVDSVLIDEARTPLIISGPASSTPENYIKANEVALQLVEGETADFEIDIKDRHVTLTDEGIEKAGQLFGVENLYDAESMHLPHFLDNALKAHHLYTRDKEYLVVGGQVKIVDEFTGRAMEGRRWSDGLHQAVEAKEGVNVEQESQTYATITLQNYFRMYDKLSGMTGTAMTEAHEFNDIYRLQVVAIPTNKPVIRRDMPDLIFGSEDEKFEAIAEGVAEINAIGQPVLVGTASVDVSERLSALFKKKGVRHEVLNARQHSREADVVKRAGHLGSVTVATNMAGRGTDIVLGFSTPAEVLKHWQRSGMAPKKIKLDSPDANEIILDCWLDHFLGAADAVSYKSATAEEKLNVINKTRGQSGFHPLPMPGVVLKDGLDMRALGGLRIVGTERHESRRIDNQLRGRSGRQGDVGASRFYLSLDDDLMKRFAPPFMANAMRRMGLKDGVPIESKMVTRSVEKAQKKVEEVHCGMRKRLLEDDEVMNIQRTRIYEQRQRILEGEKLEEPFIETINHALDDLIQEEAAGGLRGNQLAENIAKSFAENCGLPAPAADEVPIKKGGDPCREFLLARIKENVEARRAELGDELMDQLYRFVMLETIDHSWKDHLYAMDHLKHGIGLESYGQKDPRLRFKEKGFELFMGTVSKIRRDTLRMFFRIQVDRRPQQPAPVPGAEGMMQAGGFAPRTAASHPEPVTPVSANAPEHASAASVAAANQRSSSLNGPTDPAAKPKPGDPCPCGSGLAYQQCHGDF